MSIANSFVSESTIMLRGGPIVFAVFWVGVSWSDKDFALEGLYELAV